MSELPPLWAPQDRGATGAQDRGPIPAGAPTTNYLARIASHVGSWDAHARWLAAKYVREKRVTQDHAEFVLQGGPVEELMPECGGGAQQPAEAYVAAIEKANEKAKAENVQ